MATMKKLETCSVIKATRTTAAAMLLLLLLSSISQVISKNIQGG